MLFRSGLGSVVAILSTITGLLNAGGRLAYSSIGDKMKDRNSIYKIILVSELVITVIAILTGALNNTAVWAVIIVLALLFTVNAGYGGGFSNLPTLLSDVYGMGSISSLHGIALSAWAIAGLTGNQVAALIVEKTGNFADILVFTVIMYAIAVVIDFFLIKPNKAAKA